VTNLFGFDGSKNSNYLEGAAAIDVGAGITLTPHLGYQRVAKNSDFSYLDYSLTAAKDVVPGLNVSLAVVGTDTKKIGDSDAYVTPTGKNTGRLGLVLGAKYSF
jgi:hypothetical protein